MRKYEYRTDVSETSIESFSEELKTGNHSKKKEKAIRFFERNSKDKFTARELSEKTGIAYSTTTSLCNEFYHKNKIQLVGKKYNSTGKKAKAYRYNPNHLFQSREEKLKRARKKIERGKRKIEAGRVLLSEGVQNLIQIKKASQLSDA